MTTKRKKPAREPSDITTDKTETLAKHVETPSGWVREHEGDIVLTKDAAPTAQDALDVVEKHLAAGGTAQGAMVAMREFLSCPTCGTTKTGNRCAVCGHQEHDT